MKKAAFYRKFVFIHAMIFACLQIFSQNSISLKTNSIRNNDRTTYDEIGFSTLSETGGNCNKIWEITEILTSGKEYSIIYNSDDNGAYTSNDGMSIKNFMYNTNRLQQYKEENRLQNTNFIKPKLINVFPFQYGDSISETFIGKGRYCDKYDTEVKGEIFIKADAQGSIVTNGKDTLKNVLRIYTLSVSAMTMKNDYTTTDSTENKQEIEEKHEWYAKGYRYPLIMSVNKTSLSNLKPIAHTRHMYILPVGNYGIANDSINEQILKSNNKIKVSVKKPDFTYNIKTNGTSISIDCTTDYDTDCKLIITDSSGIIYKRADNHIKPKERQTINIDCSDLRQGQYVIYINANDSIFSNSISL